MLDNPTLLLDDPTLLLDNRTQLLDNPTLLLDNPSVCGAGGHYPSPTGAAIREGAGFRLLPHPGNLRQDCSVPTQVQSFSLYNVCNQLLILLLR